jgi:hypothetical protein
MGTPRPPRPRISPKRAPRRGPLLALALLVGAASPACEDLPEELCEARCDCTGCAEEELEICVAEAAADEDVAAAYGCDEPHEAHVLCELTKSRCRDGRFFLDGLDCTAELAELNECRVRGSSLD